MASVTYSYPLSFLPLEAAVPVLCPLDVEFPRRRGLEKDVALREKEVLRSLAPPWLLAAEELSVFIVVEDCEYCSVGVTD